MRSNMHGSGRSTGSRNAHECLLVVCASPAWKICTRHELALFTSLSHASVREHVDCHTGRLNSCVNIRIRACLKSFCTTLCAVDEGLQMRAGSGPLARVALLCSEGSCVMYICSFTQENSIEFSGEAFTQENLNTAVHCALASVPGFCGRH
jgi:hypothetical protein